MEFTMSATIDTRLNTFNTLALNFQDEAYTLAFYLLGDEARAAEVTQTAFASLYQRGGIKLDRFRLETLRRVLADCRAESGWITPRLVHGDTADGCSERLLALKVDERSAAVLVDVLNLDYAGAADVLGCSIKQLGRLLAQARMHLSREMEHNW